jgi:hypothetical protein
MTKIHPVFVATLADKECKPWLVEDLLIATGLANTIRGLCFWQ